MRLQAITIKNFRSIRSAFRVPLSEMTVLVGPNNVGKSNVLRALVIALRTLLDPRPRFRRAGPGRNLDDATAYDWERDFPVGLQDSNPNGASVFLLDFAMTPTEEEQFAKKVGSKVKTPLPIEIRIGASGPPEVSVRKKGPGSRKVTQKRAEITRFLSDRLDVDYIPAVRTAEASAAVVAGLVGRELMALEEEPEYIAAIDKIRELQQPILSRVSESVRDSLRQFLPTVTSVDISIAEARRMGAMRQAEIVVDDGTATELQYKGDGIQSLATIALLRFAASAARGDKDVILVLEEPESHLHPAAIRELHEVLRTLASTQQVVVTTHCGLFVDRESVGRNVIVEGGKARAAKRIDEIRHILGIHSSDNLQHAELVLVVEGEDDRICLRAILTHRSSALASALKSNRLSIDSLAGATNLAYKLGLLRNGLCTYLCFLDDDAAAQQAVVAATKERLVDSSNVLYAKLSHLPESEFEDLLDDSLVAGVLSAEWAVASVTVPPAFQRKKWSDRMKEAFRIAGQKWDDQVEARLKLSVANAVAASPATAVRSTTSGPIDNLVKILEQRLAR